jgi:hypothetical protein
MKNFAKKNKNKLFSKRGLVLYFSFLSKILLYIYNHPLNNQTILVDGMGLDNIGICHQT